MEILSRKRRETILRDADTASAMVQTLVNAFDELVRIADASYSVDVNIAFDSVTIVEP